MKLFIALLCGILMYFAQMYLYKRLWDRSLSITVDFEKPVVRAGEENELIEVISNDKWLPLPVVQIKFAITRTFRFKSNDNSAVTDQYYRNDYFSLLPYRRITRKYGFVCTQRGCFRMNGMDVICKDLFLKGMMLKSLKHEEMVCVLPLRIPPEEIPVSARELMGEITDNIRRNEDPFEFAGIREYQSYDPMNRINWKASARSSELRVNKFNTTFSQRIVLCLNMECHIKWHEDVFIEEEIRIAAALADRFISEHIPVALYTNGLDAVTGNVVSIEAGADFSHLGNIELALSRIDKGQSALKLIETLKRLEQEKTYDNTEFVIISNYRKQDMVDMYEGMKSRGANVSWIIPEYGMVEPRVTQKGDRRIVKWTVKDAR